RLFHQRVASCQLFCQESLSSCPPGTDGYTNKPHHPSACRRQANRHPQTTAADYSLISISTPAGKFNRVKFSIVLLPGSTTSISRLCVRISNCSRLSLSMNVERITVNFSKRVGNGT